jgi:hypothetical protein
MRPKVGLPTLVAAHLPPSTSMVNAPTGWFRARWSPAWGRHGSRDRRASRHRHHDARFAEWLQAGKALQTADHFNARVDLIVTELAVIRPTAYGLMLMETMPGGCVRDVIQASDARLQIADGLL